MWTTWHDDGRLAERGTFSNGVKHGLWQSWHENGQQLGEVHYVDGRPHGYCSLWNSNGVQVGLVHFVEGELEGRCEYWNGDGSLDGERSGEYMRGLRIRELDADRDSEPLAAASEDEAENANPLSVRWEALPSLQQDTDLSDLYHLGHDQYRPAQYQQPR